MKLIEDIEKHSFLKQIISHLHRREKRLALKNKFEILHC
jgi:hypothetical protein